MTQGCTVMEKKLLDLETQMKVFHHYHQPGAVEEEDDAASALHSAGLLHRAEDVGRKLLFLRNILQAEMSSGGNREESDRLQQVTTRIDALEEALAKWNGSTTTATTPTGGGGGVGVFLSCDCTNACFEEGFVEDAVEKEGEDVTVDDEGRPEVDDVRPSPCNAGMEEAISDEEENMKKKKEKKGLCLCCNKACMVLLVAVAGAIALANVLMGDEVEFLVPT